MPYATQKIEAGEVMPRTNTQFGTKRTAQIAQIREIRRQKDVQVCRTCRAVKQDYLWKRVANPEFYIKKYGKIMRWVECPACAMIRTHTAEGIIRIMQIPDNQKAALTHLIAVFINQISRIDCQCRLVSCTQEDEGKTWVFALTKAYMGAKLVRKIREIYPQTVIHTSFVQRPEGIGEHTEIVFANSHSA